MPNRQRSIDVVRPAHRFSCTGRWLKTVLPALLAGAVALALFAVPAAAQDDPLDQARGYIAAENYTAASNLLRSITRKADAPLEAFLMLAISYEKQNLTDRAIKAYEDVMRIDPSNLDGGIGLGRNLAQTREDRPRAVNLYRSLLKKYPDEPQLHFGLGMVYNKMAEVTYAFEEYKVLKEMDANLAQQLYDAIFLR